MQIQRANTGSLSLRELRDNEKSAAGSGISTKDQIVSEDLSVITEKGVMNDQADARISLVLSEEGKTQKSGAGQLESAMLALEQLQRMAEEARESSKNAAEEARITALCYTIAMRLVAGDKVPTKDINFLREHHPEMFSMAMKFRIPKADPEEHESVLKREDEKRDAMDLSLEPPGGAEDIKTT